MEDIKKESEVPIAFTAVGKPLTKQQLYKDLKAAEKEIENGDFFTIEEIRRESNQW